jgi:hypothetical protein
VAFTKDSMLSRYAGCATYIDRGKSVTTFTPEQVHDASPAGESRRETGGSPRRLVIEFDTAFDRARGGFRFEYRATGLSHEKRCILWRTSHGAVRTWWSQSTGIASGEIESLLAVHAGTSAGVSSLVPVLLLGRALPFALAEATTEGAEHRLDAQGRRMTLWAREDDQAIVRWTAQHRRVKMGDLLGHGPRDTADAVTALHRSTIEQVVTMEPAFDVPLGAGRFERIADVD